MWCINPLIVPPEGTVLYPTWQFTFFLRSTFSCFFVIGWFFSKSRFSNSSFSMSSNLNPDKAWHFVRPDLGPNCLQRLSAQVGKETTAKQKFAKKLLPRVKKSTVTSVGFLCEQWILILISLLPASDIFCSQPCTDPKGRVDRGSWPPTPLKITKLWSSLAILVQILWKITKLPSQRSTVGHHQPASETPFKWPFAGGPMMVHFKW